MAKLKIANLEKKCLLLKTSLTSKRE